MTIVNDDSRIISEQSFELIDDARGLIYDRRMFIIQSTGACTIKHFGFVIHRRHGKLVCLFVEASVFVLARRH
jgi:hypothetical protein